MIKITKIATKIILLTVVLFSFAAVARAQQPYTVLAPLPGTTSCGQNGGTNCTTSIAQYIPGAFNLAIGVSAVLAFVMITFGGIMYATSDAITGKSQGREYATNAIYGLLLVLGAYAILNTINPELLRINLTIAPINLAAGTTSVVATSTSSGGTAPCTGCVSIASVNNEIPTRSRPMWASPTLANRLSRVSDYLGGFPWQVNEAATTVAGVHVSTSCHNSGTCADVVPINRRDPGSINQVFNGLSAGGFSLIVFEVQTQAEADSFRRGCGNCTPPVPSLNSRISISVNASATGPHFHVVQ